MEAIFEILFEIIIIGLFTMPGAFYRWLISRLWFSKKTFKDFSNEDGHLNGILGLLITVLLIGIISLSIN